MQTEITIAFVNPPKQHGWSGSVKDKAGAYWGCKEDMLANFTPGSTYTVEYATREKDGKTYKDIKKVVSASTPAPKANVVGNGYADPQRDDKIAVLAILKAYIENGKIDLRGESLAASIKMIKERWREAWGPAKPAPVEDFNDEISL